MFMRCKAKDCGHELCKLADWTDEAPRGTEERDRRNEVLYQAVIKHPGYRRTTGMDILLPRASDKIQ